MLKNYQQFFFGIILNFNNLFWLFVAASKTTNEYAIIMIHVQYKVTRFQIQCS